MSLSREENEKAIISCICDGGLPMFDKAMLRGLKAEDFTFPSTRKTWNVLEGMAKCGTKIDLVTVKIALAGDNDDAYKTLSQAISECGLSFHFDSYIDFVLDASLRDKMCLCLKAAESIARDTSAIAEFSRARIESMFAALESSSTSTRKDFKSILEEQQKFFRMAHERGCAGLPTGFRFWNSIGGCLPNSLTYISGKPASFKTTLMRGLIEYVVFSLGERVDMITLEQTSGMVAGAMACRRAGVSMADILSGRNSSALAKVEAAAKEISDCPLHLIDTPQTPTTLWSWARRATDAGSKLLAVDYAQLVRGEGRYTTEEQRVSEISATFRDIAKTLGTPLVVISSENSAGGLRSSLNIEYDAWTWLRCEKVEEIGDQKAGTIVEVKKQRFGETGKRTYLEFRNGGLVEKTIAEMSEEQAYEEEQRFGQEDF